VTPPDNPREPGSAEQVGAGVPGGFDRVRRRAGGPRRPVRIDAEGKRALFSPTDTGPAAGTVTIECSSCRTRTSLAPVQAARVVLPGLHLPLPRRHASLIRCPACGRRTWCRVRLRL
jgi:hypothetical protein